MVRHRQELPETRPPLQMGKKETRIDQGAIASIRDILGWINLFVAGI